MYDSAMVDILEKLSKAIDEQDENKRLGLILQSQWLEQLVSNPGLMKTEIVPNHCLVGNGTNKLKRYKVNIYGGDVLNLLNVYMAQRLGRQFIVMKPLIYPTNFDGLVRTYGDTFFTPVPKNGINFEAGEMSFSGFVTHLSEKLEIELNQYKVFPETDIGLFFAKYFDTIFDQCKEMLMKSEKPAPTTSVVVEDIPPKAEDEQILVNKTHVGWVAKLKEFIGIKL